MKIGDKVRFLNAVGGGIVRRFQGKDIAFVEDPDGFEVPALIRECVVVGSDDFTAKPVVAGTVEVKPVVEAMPEKKEQKPRPVMEVSGRDKLNVYLAYLPMNIKEIGKCNFETYFINDSNYFLFYNYMNRENNAWNSRVCGIIEPNTQLFLEEFSKGQLNDLEKICVQLIAFKKDKPYSLKNPCSVELRIEGVNFYKLHSFRENDFFEDEALIYPIVVNDAVEREMLISATDLQEAMTQKAKAEKPHRHPAPAKTNRKPEIVEVDLHIHELIDNIAGLNNTEMLNLQLDKFRQTLGECKSKPGQRIVFIHGKGEGVLRNAILSELKTKYPKYACQDASFREYGFGATMVTIRN